MTAGGFPVAEVPLQVHLRVGGTAAGWKWQGEREKRVSDTGRQATGALTGTTLVPTAADVEHAAVQPSARAAHTDARHDVFRGSAACTGGAQRRRPVGKALRTGARRKGASPRRVGALRGGRWWTRTGGGWLQCGHHRRVGCCVQWGPTGVRCRTLVASVTALAHAHAQRAPRPRTRLVACLLGAVKGQEGGKKVRRTARCRRHRRGDSFPQVTYARTPRASRLPSQRAA